MNPHGIPSEFKSLFIPYQVISQDDINELNAKFQRKESNEEIKFFEEFLQYNAHLIYKYARSGGMNIA